MKPKQWQAHLHATLDRVEVLLAGSLPQPWPEGLRDALDDLRDSVKHGTRGHYQTGCRHPLCVEANAIYERTRGRRLRQQRAEAVRRAAQESEDDFDQFQQFLGKCQDS